MERRMEMPIGEKPAAKVIRKSTRPKSSSVAPVTVDDHTTTSSVVPEEADVSRVLGDIVERKTARGKKKTNTEKVTTASTKQASKLSAEGFPSLHRPIGTFLSTKQQSPLKKASNSPSRHDDETTTTVRTTTSKQRHGKSNNDLSNLHEASSKDADAILAGMSQTEIQQTVAELQQSLDPSIVEFLRNRQHTKNQETTKIGDNSSSKIMLEVSMDQPTTDSEKIKESNDITEKEEMAKLLSSVRTYDDLDTVYQEFNEKGSLQQQQQSSSNVHGRDEFEIACELLRSTSPHQTFWACRTVCHKLLSDNWKNNNNKCRYNIQRNKRNSPWPHPVLLPVSLRCLLDVPLKPGGSILQTTFVLQSLYSLLMARACVEHVVDFLSCDDTSMTQSHCYQIYFLDDAVPTPAISSCYRSAPIQSISENESGTAYATASSSKSAKADGEAFIRDPMWTLLSSMRIIPRIAEILQFNGVLPDEATIAICGILAMVGQRSPAAASAIVHHSTLFDDLEKKTLEPIEEESNSSSTLAIPMVILMCTLARQSRATAELLGERMERSSFFFRILSETPVSRLQQWTLILWRTLLHYGLCLHLIPSVLTIEAQWISLGISNPDNGCDSISQSNLSIVPELYTSFANVFHFYRLSQTLDESFGSDSSADSNENTILNNVPSWLFTSKQQAIHQLGLLLNQSTNFEESTSQLLRYVASILLYIRSVLLTEETCNSQQQSGFISSSEIEALVGMLSRVVENKSLDLVFLYALRFARVTDFNKISSQDPVDADFEASACAMCCSLLNIVTCLNNCKNLTKFSRHLPRNKLESISTIVQVRLEGTLKSVLTSNFLPSIRGKGCRATFQRTRQRWINCAHADVARFLYTSLGYSAMIQGFVFTIFGRLDLGDESVASSLLYCSNLFDCSTSSGLPSYVVRGFLSRELTGKSGHRQITHSRTLDHQQGIIDSDYHLQTLLSEVPVAGAPEWLLPIGQYWLWQLLSGLVVPSSAENTKTPDESEAIPIILSCLQIITQLEDHDASYGYASQLDTGAKVYFLVNLCFQPASILSNSEIIRCALFLFERYFFCFSTSNVLIFSDVCTQHFADKTISRNDLNRVDLSRIKADQKIEDIQELELSDSEASDDQLNAVNTLVSDICDIYLERFALFPFYTKCIRLFFANGFPAKIKCTVLRSLRDYFHLLDWDGDDRSVKQCLEKCLQGGLPEVDESVKDPPVLIDEAVNALVSLYAIYRDDAIFIKHWTTALVIRSFAISVTTSSTSGLLVSKKRLQRFECPLACSIVTKTARFLSSDGTLDSLIDVVDQHNADTRNESAFFNFNGTNLENKWDQTVENLFSIRQKQ
jgi:hypothetical protein